MEFIYDKLLIFGEETQSKDFAKSVYPLYIPKYLNLKNAEINFIKTFENDICIGYNQFTPMNPHPFYSTMNLTGYGSYIWLGKKLTSIYTCKEDFAVKYRIGRYENRNPTIYGDNNEEIDLFKLLINIENLDCNEQIKNEFKQLCTIYLNKNEENIQLIPKLSCECVIYPEQEVKGIRVKIV